MMKNAPTTLYQFVDFDINIFISKYLYEISEHDTCAFVYCDTPQTLLEHGLIQPEDYEEKQRKFQQRKEECTTHHKEKRGTKKVDVITWKVQYLQDLIIRRAISKKNGVFNLDSQMLKRIIGDEYSTMLSILIQMGYLRYGDGKNGELSNKYLLYSIGDYSMIYSIPENTEVAIINIVNAKIQGYKEKAKKIISEHYTNNVYPSIDARYGVGFTDNYHKSLRLISVEDSTGLNLYVCQKVQLNPKSNHYYNYLLEGLNDKEKHIQSIDNAGRIYHILTNADRDIKQFLNILISADCKNSHPVLFNYFIFKRRKIETGDAYMISMMMHKIPESYNIRLALKSHVSNHVLDMLSDDELNYIYLTSTGKLWDNIASEHPEIDRNEVKEKMFAEVFYSNRQRTYQWQEYATEFRAKFPNVMQSIKYWKYPTNAPDIKSYMDSHGISSGDKPTASLSIAMMNLEANIFTEILKRIYKKRWKAVHIHDCVIVPKTKGKNQPTREQIVSIMQEVYRDYGLSPTFD